MTLHLLTGNIFPATFLLLSCPLKKGMDYKLNPKKKKGSENTSKRFSLKAKHLWLQGLVARRAGIYI